MRSKAKSSGPHHKLIRSFHQVFFAEGGARLVMSSHGDGMHCHCTCFLDCVFPNRTSRESQDNAGLSITTREHWKYSNSHYISCRSSPKQPLLHS